MTVKSDFTNGGFVLHEIPTRAGATKLSAWYNQDGEMTDCEAVNILGQSYRPSMLDIEHCKTLGKVWK